MFSQQLSAPLYLEDGSLVRPPQVESGERKRQAECDGDQVAQRLRTDTVSIRSKVGRFSPATLRKEANPETGNSVVFCILLDELLAFHKSTAHHDALLFDPDLVDVVVSHLDDSRKTDLYPTKERLAYGVSPNRNVPVFFQKACVSDKVSEVFGLMLSRGVPSGVLAPHLDVFLDYLFLSPKGKHYKNCLGAVESIVFRGAVEPSQLGRLVQLIKPVIQDDGVVDLEVLHQCARLCAAVLKTPGPVSKLLGEDILFIRQLSTCFSDVDEALFSESLLRYAATVEEPTLFPSSIMMADSIASKLNQSLSELPFNLDFEFGADSDVIRILKRLCTHKVGCEAVMSHLQLGTFIFDQVFFNPEQTYGLEFVFTHMYPHQATRLIGIKEKIGRVPLFLEGEVCQHALIVLDKLSSTPLGSKLIKEKPAVLTELVKVLNHESLGGFEERVALTVFDRVFAFCGFPVAAFDCLGLYEAVLNSLVKPDVEPVQRGRCALLLNRFSLNAEMCQTMSACPRLMPALTQASEVDTVSFNFLDHTLNLFKNLIASQDGIDALSRHLDVLKPLWVYSCHGQLGRLLKRDFTSVVMAVVGREGGSVGLNRHPFLADTMLALSLDSSVDLDIKRTCRSVLLSSALHPDDRDVFINSPTLMPAMQKAFLSTPFADIRLTMATLFLRLSDKDEVKRSLITCEGMVKCLSAYLICSSNAFPLRPVALKLLLALSTLEIGRREILSQPLFSTSFDHMINHEMLSLEVLGQCQQLKKQLCL